MRVIPKGAEDKIPVMLPPAGYKRREELARRTDALEEAAEEHAKHFHPIDPDKLEVEREIAKHFTKKGFLKITNEQPGYTYFWAAIDDPQTFTWKKTLGWEVVKGDMPEAREITDENNMRRVGDVILMRIPTWRYEIIRKFEEGESAKSQEVEMSQALGEMADSAQARTYGIKVHPLKSEEEMIRLHARNVAREEIGKMLKDGGALAQLAPHLFQSAGPQGA